VSETNDLTPAEMRVWQAFPWGESVDFRATENEDPALGDTWGAGRTVRASVLRELLLKAPHGEGKIAALQVSGARITGELDLKHAAIDAAIRLSHCHFDGVPDLYGAQLRELDLSGSVLPGLSLGALRVEGVVPMTDCRLRRSVRLGRVSSRDHRVVLVRSLIQIIEACRWRLARQLSGVLSYRVSHRPSSGLLVRHALGRVRHVEPT
jgi:hypothetical protein